MSAFSPPFSLRRGSLVHQLFIVLLAARMALPAPLQAGGGRQR